MGLGAKWHSTKVQAVQMAEGSVESQRRRVRSEFLQGNLHQASSEKTAIQLHRGFLDEMARGVLAVHRALRLSRPQRAVPFLRGGFRATGLLPRRGLEPLGPTPQ